MRVQVPLSPKGTFDFLILYSISSFFFLIRYVSLIQSILLQMDRSGIFLIIITSLGICGIRLEYVLEYVIEYIYIYNIREIFFYVINV